VNAQRSKSRPFDASRTGLFPGSCLPRRRHPGYPAVQASLPTLALGCGCGWRLYSGPGGVFYVEEGALRQPRKVPVRKGSHVKSNRPSFSWWLHNVTGGDGRRVITLWRSPSANLNASRAVNRPRAGHRKPGVKLRVQFARQEAAVVVPIKVTVQVASESVTASERGRLVRVFLNARDARTRRPRSEAAT
jgi:hypothetical protein